MGLLSVTIDVQGKHRRALEAMGLIASGNGENREAIAWAVARFLDTAPAIENVGRALYPNVDDYFLADDDDASPQNTGENEG